MRRPRVQSPSSPPGISRHYTTSWSNAFSAAAIILLTFAEYQPRAFSLLSLWVVIPMSGRPCLSIKYDRRFTASCNLGSMAAASFQKENRSSASLYPLCRKHKPNAPKLAPGVAGPSCAFISARVPHARPSCMLDGISPWKNGRLFVTTDGSFDLGVAA